ncbi:hypothetical protein YC2023_058520 [Brassica napus]
MNHARRQNQKALGSEKLRSQRQLISWRRITPSRLEKQKKWRVVTRVVTAKQVVLVSKSSHEIEKAKRDPIKDFWVKGALNSRKKKLENLMKPFNSNLKAKATVKANEAETSDIDHLEHILGKHWLQVAQDVRDGSNRERLEKFSSSEDKSNGVGAVEAAMLSLSVAAEKMDPSHFATCLDEVLNEGWYLPETQMLELIDYYGNGFSHVSFQWVTMFEEYPLSKLIDIPISLIPKPLYEKSIDFINTLPFDTLSAFVLWSSDLILTEWPGVVKVEQRNSNKSKVATFVVLAMALRTQPDALTLVLTNMKERPTYQGQDKLPVIIWMMAQASQGDLSAGLFSWVQTLLPLVVNECCSSQAIDLILQFVEMILSSNPESRAVLLNEPVRHGVRLIPPCSFEMLVRLTFPPSSARVESTQRFEAIYPLLKEVALAPDISANALKQIFTFSLKLAGGQGIGGNPALANEATAIAISVLTQNVDCFKQWDVLYKENLEASVALLNKLVDEWKDHSLKLSSSSSDTLTVKHAMNSFRMKVIIMPLLKILSFY